MQNVFWPSLLYLVWKRFFHSGYTTPVILLQIVMVISGTHLMKNHESQSRTIESKFKNTSPWVYVTVTITVNLKLCQYSLLKEKIYSFYCPAQQRLKEIWPVKQQLQEPPQKSHKQDIRQKHLQIDQSIFASYGTHTTNYFARLGIVMRQERRTQR